MPKRRNTQWHQKGQELQMKRRSNDTTYPSVGALASELGISRQAAYSALRQGVIPHIRIGKRFVLPRAAIAEWLRTAGKLGPTGLN
jgi:excisionase family DNA binding protein